MLKFIDLGKIDIFIVLNLNSFLRFLVIIMIRYFCLFYFLTCFCEGLEKLLVFMYFISKLPIDC